MTQYERYGDYIVNRKEALGMGKFGTVWRGYRIVGDEGGEYLEPVAIKESSYDQQNIQEINTLQILKHPNIIRYIDYKISGESLFMVMELCEGGTLEDLLMRFDDEEDLTDQVVHYYSQVVRGIKCIYDKDILHRDIKPSNILIKDNKVKIADFGTSKLKQGNEMIKTLVGTPLFASPEILELFVGDEQSYTEKSDIWSLGLILYCMYHYQKHPEAPLQRLKDSLPWKGKNAVEVLNNIKNKPLEFNCPKMPQEIKAIISHMLTIDVEKRMSFKEFFEIGMFQTH
jgi:serine/threonine protein kinase